jgi:hypothetical protein
VKKCRMQNAEFGRSGSQECRVESATNLLFDPFMARGVGHKRVLNFATIKATA